MTRILKTVGAVVLLTLIGCGNFTLPKKAQVIANPTYNLGLGETSFALKDYFSIEELSEMFGTAGEENSSSQVAVYDYIPDPAENLQRYAIHYSLGKIDLDVGSYLEDTNFDDINIDIPEQKIQIPTVDFTQSKTILEKQSGQTVSSNYEISVPVEVSLDTPNSSDGVSVKKLVVQEGFLKIQASNFNGVSFKVDSGNPLTLTIGDEDKEVTPSEDGKSGTFDLTGVTLIDTKDNGGFKISGDVNLSGGTVPDGGIKIEITGNIDTIKSVSVELPEDVTEQLERNVAVDVTEMAKSVSSVTFNTVGAEGTFYSTLPEGNEFDVSVASAPLGLENLEQEISSGEQSVNFFTAKNKTLTMDSLKTGESYKLPFTVSVGLPKDNDGYYRFVNVKAGETYTIGAQLKGVLDWSEVSIKQSAFAGEGSPLKGEMSGIDLSSLKTTMDELFPDQPISSQIEFTEIGIYPFITKPTGDILNGIEASGVIQMTYTNKDGNNKIVLVGNSDGSAGEIKLVEKGPALPESSDKPYTQDLDKAVKENKVSAEIDKEEVSGMLNDYPSDLALVYDVKITGAGNEDISVSKKDIDDINESGGTTSISMDVVLTVPLRIKLRGDAVTINMKPVENDLLNRNGVSGIDENIRKIFNSLEQVTLAVDYENNFGSGLTVKVKNTPKETSNGMSIESIEAATFEYELEELVASGSQTLKIEIKGSDIKDKILGAYPFAPEITVKLTGEKEKDSDDKYVVKIPREAELSADLRFSAGASINGVYDFTKGTFEIVEGN